MLRLKNLHRSLRISAIVPSLMALCTLIPLTTAAQSDDMREFVYSVGQFTELRVGHNINVIYRANPDSTGFAVFRAPLDKAGIYDLFMHGEKLSIDINPAYRDCTERPTLTVYSDFLDGVENYGDSLVLVSHPAPCPKFKAQQIGNGRLHIQGLRTTKAEATLLAGNGTLKIAGRAPEIACKMRGAGTIDALDFNADNVKCSIIGTGEISCNPLSNLNVSGIGTTVVRYKGNPKIKSNGAGRLESIDNTPTP